MSEHKLSAAGTCQRCGFHTGRDADQPCEPRVIFIPSKRRVWDYIAPNGVTFYGRKTLAEIQFDEGTDAVIVTAEEGYRLMCEAFRTPVTEIDAERYDDMLNVLPPCQWRGVGESFECFHVSERITGNIVNWFARLRTESGEAFYTCADYATLSRYELAERVHAFVKAQRAALASGDAA